MTGKIQCRFFMLINILISLCFSLQLIAQGNQQENERCLKCHSKLFINLTDSVTGNIIKHQFPKSCVINSTLFYSSNHKNLTCVFCHSEDFATFPHPKELKNKVMSACMNCHSGDDEKYTRFHFENINKDFIKSAHAMVLKENFSCNNCHSQHYFKVTASKSDDIKSIVNYDNMICMRCHNDQKKYNQFVNTTMADIGKAHSWLPNQALHFESVRCIDCHNEPTDSTVVPHFVMPKKLAQKNCVACHSNNPEQLQNLYKFNIKEVRENGYSAATLLNSSLIIGFNRNFYLNAISIIAFVLILLFIIVHFCIRVRANRKK
jgi:hypothetical protein